VFGRRGVVAAALLALCAASAQGQEPAAPEVVVVFGDSQAAGVARGLQRVLIEDSRFRILNRTHAGAAMVHGRNEWLEPIRRFVAKEKADTAVVMFGANDRLDFRDDDGSQMRFRTEDWRLAYMRRTEEILMTLTQAGLKVVWCGNPIARSGTYSADMGYINDVYAEATIKYGARFLPLWSAVTDDKGQYAAYGKDRDGVTQRLRNDDGIHFTAAGYELIADKIVGALPPSERKPAP
jgi:hypothetical protein